MLYFIASRDPRISKSSRSSRSALGFAAAVSGAMVSLAMASLAMAQNAITLEVVDPETGQALPSRIEFTKSAKKLNRDRKTLAWGDTWLVEGSMALQPPPGDYEFLARRGPEFGVIRGGFTLERAGRDTVRIEIPRLIDLHEEGWFSGDVSSELEPGALARWQAAEALDMAVASAIRPAARESQTPARKSKDKEPQSWGGPEAVGHRWSSTSIEFRSSTVGLAVHRVPRGQGDLTSPPTSLPSSDPYEALEAIEEDPGAIAEITQLMVPDLPILLAHPKVRMVRVLNLANRETRDATLELDRKADDALFGKLSIELGRNRWAFPVLAPFPDKDQIRFRGPRGAGLVSEAIYWRTLDAGLRLSPSAASGFGAVDTHLGYNRVYAYCDSEQTPEAWWHAIEKGESFITNGPLLRVLINGVPPGTAQASYTKEPIPLSIDASLAVREPVDYLDVIFNGETLYNAKLEDHHRRGEFPPLEAERSGWLVLRVVTAHPDGYRFATTAPFYFEFDGQPRIDRKAVVFFQEWLERLETSIADASVDTPARGRAVARAKAFWQDKLAASE